MSNIGIDIDGVITTPYYWLGYFNNLFDKKLIKEQCIQYNLRELFNIPEEEWIIKTKETIKDFLDSVDTRTDAIEVIKRIKQTHNCCFITARNNNDYVRQRTKDYLKNIKLHDIKLYMLNSHYKVDKAKELDIKYFVEDCGDNAFQLAEKGIKVFLIDTNYNQNIKHKNVIRVKDWYEIEQLLQEDKNV